MQQIIGELPKSTPGLLLGAVEASFIYDIEVEPEGVHNIVRAWSSRGVRVDVHGDPTARRSGYLVPIIGLDPSSVSAASTACHCDCATELPPVPGTGVSGAPKLQPNQGGRLPQARGV
jgi:hypothetical protein